MLFDVKQLQQQRTGVTLDTLVNLTLDREFSKNSIQQQHRNTTNEIKLCDGYCNNWYYLESL